MKQIIGALPEAIEFLKAAQNTGNLLLGTILCDNPDDSVVLRIVRNLSKITEKYPGLQFIDPDGCLKLINIEEEKDAIRLKAEEITDIICTRLGINKEFLPALLLIDNSSAKVFSLEPGFDKILFSGVPVLNFSKAFNFLPGAQNLIKQFIDSLSQPAQTLTIQKSPEEILNEIFHEISSAKNALTYAKNKIMQLISEYRSGYPNLQEEEQFFSADTGTTFKEDVGYNSAVEEYNEKFLSKTREVTAGEEFPAIKIPGVQIPSAFEKEAKNWIETGLTVEEVINRSPNTQVEDYSVFAIGYWKAAELELNIIVADALRYYCNLISKIPSQGNAEKEDQREVYAGIKHNKTYRVNINNQYKKKLNHIPAGDQLRLAEYSKDNEMGQLFALLKSRFPNSQPDEDFLRNFAAKFRDLLHNYRNKGSHTERLSKKEYTNLKKLLFDEGGLFEMINEQKQAVMVHYNSTKIN